MEEVEGTLITMLICIRVTVRQTIADQQERSAAEGFGEEKNTASCCMLHVKKSQAGRRLFLSFSLQIDAS